MSVSYLARRLGELRNTESARTSFTKALVSTLMLIAAIWGASFAVSPWFRLGINGTDSLPGLVYFVVKDQMPSRRGDIVALRPPANRFYPARMVFLKKVVGLPGDRVTRIGRDFYVNGRYVGTAKSHARSGEALAPGPVGVIPDGSYFVWAPHPDSYDSRYEDIGWVPANRLVGHAHRLL